MYPIYLLLLCSYPLLASAYFDATPGFADFFLPPPSQPQTAIPLGTRFWLAWTPSPHYNGTVSLDVTTTVPLGYIHDHITGGITYSFGQYNWLVPLTPPQGTDFVIQMSLESNTSIVSYSPVFNFIDPSTRLSVGAKAGIGVGAVVGGLYVMGALGLGGWFLVKCLTRRKGERSEGEGAVFLKAELPGDMVRERELEEGVMETGLGTFELGGEEVSLTAGEARRASGEIPPQTTTGSGEASTGDVDRRRTIED